MDIETLHPDNRDKKRVTHTKVVRKNPVTGAENSRPKIARKYATPTALPPLTAIPRSTLRLQLHKDFTFADAQARVPYFAQLGISHLYLSPILTARSGSMHGYDLVDHGTVNPELGGETGFRELVAVLREHNMGVIVDIVPNHMAVGNADNRLWLDVLEWGRNSRYANFFDIDWDVPDPVLKNRVLAPFLGKPYGDALREGELQLQFDGATGRFSVQYFEHKFPIAPNNYAQLLRLGGAELSGFSKRFRETTAQRISLRGDEFGQVCAELAASYSGGKLINSDQALDADPKIIAAIAALLTRFNEGDHALLHQLLERQHYRLSYWRNAADEINWRRFFDVIQLIGIRIQNPSAFEVVHATTFRLYAEGLIDGVRIDHIDGLSDPRTYCRRLRVRLKKLARERPPTAPGGPAYIIVEKILAPEERLPREWGVDGTTGYSFMNDVSALLHDPAGEPALTELWTELSGRSGDFDSENQRARRRILQELLAAEFNSCALALHRIARSDLHTRDWSLLAIRRVLQELLIQFPIYRTYADARGRSNADDQIMQQAIAAARVNCRAADTPLLELIGDWLGGEAPASASAGSRATRLRAIARFQQLTSPLAAKSVEDTAFYRHGKLLSRNEVGSNPAVFANSPDEFHAESVHRARYFPAALLSTATHDHKRGEDLRARLAVLSEIPQQWAAAVHRWRKFNRELKTVDKNSEQAWPLDADEYMLYQMLTGSWPLDLTIDDTLADAKALKTWCERLWQWWTKALREAKQLSSWGEPNDEYELACKTFLERLLNADVPGAGRTTEFLRDLQTFVESIAAAGAVNGLSQTLLKLTTPGIPDIYQGSEFWDFSLVDPDNRRPVDYLVRELQLEQFASIKKANPEPIRELIPGLIADWRNGGIKQHLIAQLLHLRAQHPELFANGEYVPLRVSGAKSGQVFAFARRWKNTTLVVAIARFPIQLGVSENPAIPTTIWGDTAITAPDNLIFSTKTPGHWYEPLTQTSFIMTEPQITCARAFCALPYAVLIHQL